MKRIPLTQGQFAVVDDLDFRWLSKFKWYAHWNSCTKSYYAERVEIRDGKRIIHRMHRCVLHDPKGKWVDHQHHDTLNNTSKNLRACTKIQNSRNRKGAQK